MAAPEVYTGKDCSVELDNGAIGNWTNYRIEITTQKESATPAKGTVYRQVTVYRHAKVTLEGYRGGTETFATLAKVDADVSNVTVTDPPPNWGDYSGWRITDANMTQPQGPGTYTMTLEQGFVGTSTLSPSGQSQPS